MTAFSYRMPAGVAGDINRAAVGMTVEAQVVTPVGTTGARLLLTACRAGHRRYCREHRQYARAGVGRYHVHRDLRPARTAVSDPVAELAERRDRSRYATYQWHRGHPEARLHDRAALGRDRRCKGRNGLCLTSVRPATNHPVHRWHRGRDIHETAPFALSPAGCYFMGPADANSITEISFNI